MNYPQSEQNAQNVPIEIAVKNFAVYLGNPEWLNGLGVSIANGKEIIVVYLSKKRHVPLPCEWQGYPIVLEKMGKIIPA